jgi:hypothetical protein
MWMKLLSAEQNTSETYQARLIAIDLAASNMRKKRLPKPDNGSDLLVARSDLRAGHPSAHSSFPLTRRPFPNRAALARNLRTAIRWSNRKRRCACNARSPRF